MLQEELIASNMHMIEQGSAHAMACARNGDLFVWGGATAVDGVLGLGKPGRAERRPVRVDSLRKHVRELGVARN